MRDLLITLVDRMVDGGIAFDDARREFERRFIERTLADTNGRLAAAAARLGLHRNSLARKLADLEIRAGRRQAARRLPAAVDRRRRD